MNLPAEPGSYTLTGVLIEPARIAVGRIGVFDFPAGLYVYCGSALGPGGLRARLCHHARRAEHPTWHFDYLRPCLTLVGGWFALTTQRLECVWGQALSRLPGALIPAPGFGARDCRRGCPAHLFHLPDAGTPDELANYLGESVLEYSVSVSRFDL